MNKSKHLVWIDLEMSGLDISQDIILEVAVIITDEQLKIVAYGPDLILSAPNLDLANINPIVHDMHTKSGLLDKIAKSQVSLEHAQDQILNFIKFYGAPKTMPLCGNSIWQDKLFLIKYMPKLIDYLHYRVIDVSTVKELVKNWYGVGEFKKTKTHRALSDIEESINELKYYREHYFVK
jgi:oligoribonuclease